MCHDELANITNVLDEKVPTFFLQPTSHNGEGRKPFAIFISLGSDVYSHRLRWHRFT